MFYCAYHFKIIVVDREFGTFREDLLGKCHVIGGLLVQSLFDGLSTFKIKSLIFLFLHFIPILSFVCLSMCSYLIFLLYIFYKVAFLRHSFPTLWVIWWLEKLRCISWIVLKLLLHWVLHLLLLIIISTKLTKMPDSWSFLSISKHNWTFSMLLVTYKLALIHGSILENLCAFSFTEIVVEVAIVNSTIRPYHFTSTVLFIHVPGSFIRAAIGPWKRTLTTHVIAVPLASICAVIRVNQNTKSMELPLVIVTDIAWSIGPLFLPLSFQVIVNILAFKVNTIKSLIRTISISFTLHEISSVNVSICIPYFALALHLIIHPHAHVGYTVLPYVHTESMPFLDICKHLSSLILHVVIIIIINLDYFAVYLPFILKRWLIINWYIIAYKL